MYLTKSRARSCRSRERKAGVWLKSARYFSEPEFTRTRKKALDTCSGLSPVTEPRLRPNYATVVGKPTPIPGPRGAGEHSPSWWYRVAGMLARHHPAVSHQPPPVRRSEKPPPSSAAIVFTAATWAILRSACSAPITVRMRNSADFDCSSQPLDVNRGVVDAHFFVQVDCPVDVRIS